MHPYLDHLMPSQEIRVADGSFLPSLLTGRRTPGFTPVVETNLMRGSVCGQCFWIESCTACVPQNKLIGHISEVRVISDETDPWEDQWGLDAFPPGVSVVL